MNLFSLEMICSSLMGQSTLDFYLLFGIFLNIKAEKLTLCLMIPLQYQGLKN